MKHKGQRRAGVVVGITLLVAVPAVALSAPAFFCRDDSVVRRECCCPGGRHAMASPIVASAHLSAVCCCDLVQATASAAPPALATRVANASAGIGAAPAHLSSGQPRLVRSPGWTAFHLAHPPPLSVPVLLGKQSFLI